MASSGPRVNEILELFEKLTEITDSLEARTNRSYSTMVAAIFSIGNVQAAYSTMIAALANDDVPTLHLVVHIEQVWETMMSKIIGSYALAVMAQDPNFSKLVEAEQHDKIRAYVENMRKDVMMLVGQAERLQ